MPRINVFRNKKNLRIYIDEKLHLLIKRKGFVGMQSWYCNTSEAERQCGFFEKKYVIEYVTDKNRITTEYNKKEVWEEMLGLLDLHL